MLQTLREWARAVRRDTIAVWIAARDPRVPWYAKAAAAGIAAYALSPIDLIPDFIPVLGYLDELLLLPVCIALVIRLIPADLMAEFRAQAAQRAERPTSYFAAAAIVLLWAVAITATAWWLWIGLAD